MKYGKLLKQAILMAEEMFPEPKSGKRKKKWVINFINEHVNLPILNERQEERLIGFAVDALCDLLEELKK
tara:strand:- start:27013 stop:27222 length:210 start_codon:yes stop_codon:yes gene_type:complete